MVTYDDFYSDPLRWAAENKPDWSEYSQQDDPTQGDEIRTPWGGYAE